MQILEVLEAGHPVDIKGPFGEQFVYLPPGKYQRCGLDYIVSKINMVAGGTGITPMYQIITSVLSDPADCTEIRLMYANNTEEDILLRKELDVLAAVHPNRFKVSYVVGCPKDGWQGSVGFVRMELCEGFMFGVDMDTVTLLCGPRGMMHACHACMGQMGFVKGLTCIEM